MQNILNFYQITDRIATSGQPAVGEFSKIKDAGYSLIINLAMSDATNAVPEEEGIIRDLGITHVHIPVPFDKPEVGHLTAFFGIMDAFKNKKVFVHCALNLRVSVFTYNYLVFKDNTDPKTAISPFLQEWIPNMDEKWAKILNLTKQDIPL